MDEIGLSYLSWTPSVRLFGQDTTCVVLVQQNHLVRRDDLVHLGYQTGIGEGASSRVPDPPLLLARDPRTTTRESVVVPNRAVTITTKPHGRSKMPGVNRTTWPRDFAHMFFTGKEGGCNWMGEETAEDVSVFWQCSLHLMYVLLDSIWLNPEQHLLFETMLI